MLAYKQLTSRGIATEAEEYSRWFLSGIMKESLKLNTGCKQTVTAVKHLLHEVSKV